MPNQVPSLERLERQKGTITMDDGSGLYMLMDWPVRVQGPAFGTFGDSCVGAYVVRLMDRDCIPSGTVHLAVWPDAISFKRGIDPVAMMDMADLVREDRPDSDEGLVVYDPNAKLYYTGTDWQDQLRTAKIYHSRHWAEDVVRNHPERTPVIRNISVRVTD